MKARWEENGLGVKMVGSPVSFLKKVPLFRSYLAANTISLLGTSIFEIAMPLYVWEKTHSPLLLAGVSVALHLPYFLMAPFTGYAVDHIDNRKLMLFADLGQVLTLLVLYLYDFSSYSAVWPILVTIFLCKSLSILFETAGTFHMIPALVSPADLSTANTWFLSSQRLIQILGPLSGGILVGLCGFRLSILLNLLSYGATLYFIFNVPELSQIIHQAHPQRHRPHTPSLRAVFRNFSRSVKYVWNSSLFRPFVFAMFFWNVSSLIPNTPTLTYYFRGHAHFSPEKFGVVMALFGLTGILGYFFSHSLYRRMEFSRAFLGACLWQAALGTISLCFFDTPLVFALVFGLSRAGSSVFAMGTFFLRQTEVPRSMVGSVNSSIRMYFMSAAPLSSLLQGFIIQHYGVKPALWLGGAALWGTLWFGRKVSRSYETGMTSPAEKQAA